MEHQDEHRPQWPAIQSIASKIGCSGGTLRNRMRVAERDDGLRPRPASEESERIKALERAVLELRQAHEILRKASAYFAFALSPNDQHSARGQRGVRLPVQAMTAFIDEPRDAHGAEPIRRALPIAPSIDHRPRPCRSPDRSFPAAGADMG